MCFNATLSNISAMSLLSAGLLMVETGVHGENNRPLQDSKSQSCIKYALPQRPKNIYKDDENTFISRYDR